MTAPCSDDLLLFSAELKGCFDDLTACLDLSRLQVTLDVICLTLPPETDLSETTNRPCYSRMTSYASQMSNVSESSSGSDDDPKTDTIHGSPFK